MNNKEKSSDRGPTVKVGSISDFVLDASNANRGTARGRKMLRRSLKNLAFPCFASKKLWAIYRCRKSTGPQSCKRSGTQNGARYGASESTDWHAEIVQTKKTYGG
jgi:hypothetical protein